VGVKNFIEGEMRLDGMRHEGNECVLAAGVESGSLVNDWAARITARWQDSVEAIIDVGRLLMQAKEDLAHGEWFPMIERLPFSARTAQMLIRISEHPAISNPNHGSDLPVSWRSLYELTKLDEPEFMAALEARLIHPEMQRKDVVKLLDVAQLETANGGMIVGPRETCSTTDLHELIAGGKRFSTIYADPPWLYGNQGTRAATSNHYDGMTVSEIAALPVAGLAEENAHLHLWTTNAFLFDCKAIMEAWGFTYKSCCVWVKPQMGIGNYWRVSHEFLLFGVRGKAPFQDRSLKSWHEEKRGRHSAKPESFRQFVERASPPSYLEMFARRSAPGWTVWGNEIEKELFYGGV
jgi:N6-adenosine-specific RNA methylase IME4